MPDARRPYYLLADIKSEVAVAGFVVTAQVAATLGRQGFDSGDIEACIQQLDEADFCESEAALLGTGNPADIYRPLYLDAPLFLRIQRCHAFGIVVTAFKSDGSL